MTERIETVRQISAENLKNGGFVFQLPETATEAEKVEFTKAIEDAKVKNLNLVLTPQVKVVDLNTPVPAPAPVVEEKKVETPATPAPAPVVEKKAEEPKKEEPVAQNPQMQPVPTLQQQPMFVMPQQFYQYGQVPFQYNPFIQTPVQAVAPPSPQPVEQPKPQMYNPVPMIPLHQFNVQPVMGQPMPATPQYVFPQFVATPPQSPAKQEEKKSQ